MTPAEAEAQFIALWNQGLKTAASTQRLQQRGLIQPRSKGGTYPRQRAKARQDRSPTPGQRLGQSIDTDMVVIVKL